MRKLLLAGIAVLAVGAAVPAYAANVTTATSTAVGATTGGTLGFLFGGPIGAIVGGFSGAVIGSQLPDTSVSFAGTHPVQQVYLNDNLDVGFAVGSSIHTYPIDGDAGHSYFYANNRVWIVDSGTGKIVASPGYVVSDRAVAYAKAHPYTSVQFQGSVAPGVVLDSGITFRNVPDANGYAYVYLNGRPALVDRGSRTVVWVE